MAYYFEGVATGADAATAAGLAEVLAQGKVRGWAASLGITGAAYANVKTALGNAGYTVDDNEVDSATNAGASYGNLYGSSKDVGTITGKLPVLSETGGRVNRVGMKRLTIEGTIEKFGFFEEYSQDSLDFDNDMELEGHITSEAVKAANEITEDQLQIDLLNGAGVVRFTGNATSVATINGGTAAQLAAGTTIDLMTYDDLVKLNIELDNNRTPKNTKLITGSRMIDTRVVNSARYAYIGSELLPTIMRMVDYHGERAFIPVAQYGAATQVAKGEVGAVADFRIIVVPEMAHWAASGANVSDVTDEVCYWSSDSTGQAKVNVYPFLVVGDGAFTTIGFQTDGKTVKFKIKHVKPGTDMSYSRDDPYGELGYYSIKWWYGSMITRPERLAVIKTVAVM